MVSARLRRGESNDPERAYSIEDYLVSLGAATKPMEAFGVDLVDAAIWVLNVFWMNDEKLQHVGALAKKLMD